MSEGTAVINRKPLGKEFQKSGFRYREIRREKAEPIGEDVAIFHKVRLPNQQFPKTVDFGFETVIVGGHDGYEIAGNKIEPAETLPSNEQWGQKGWTYGTLLGAELRFEALLRGETPDDTNLDPEMLTGGDSGDSEGNEESPATSRRGRKRVDRSGIEVKYPDGEFTMQDLADFNDMKKPNMYILFKEGIAKIEETRRVSKGRGRPTVMYKKAE